MAFLWLSSAGRRLHYTGGFLFTRLSAMFSNMLRRLIPGSSKPDAADRLRLIPTSAPGKTPVELTESLVPIEEEEEEEEEVDQSDEEKYNDAAPVPSQIDSLPELTDASQPPVDSQFTQDSDGPSQVLDSSSLDAPLSFPSLFAGELSQPSGQDLAGDHTEFLQPIVLPKAQPAAVAIEQAQPSPSLPVAVEPVATIPVTLEEIPEIAVPSIGEDDDFLQVRIQPPVEESKNALFTPFTIRRSPRKAKKKIEEEEEETQSNEPETKKGAVEIETEPTVSLQASTRPATPPTRATRPRRSRKRTTARTNPYRVTKQGKSIELPHATDLYTINPLPPLGVIRKHTTAIGTDKNEISYYEPENIPFCKEWLEERRRDLSYRRGDRFFLLRAAPGTQRRGETPSWPEQGSTVFITDKKKNKEYRGRVVDGGWDLPSTLNGRQTNYLHLREFVELP
jgi:hypothetical protein